MPRDHQGAAVTSVSADLVSVARYDVIMDPADLFIVWDNPSGSPATMDGELLGYETLSEAEHVAKYLNSGS